MYFKLINLPFDVLYLHENIFFCEKHTPMKSVKSFLLFFFLSLASISIVFEWGDYSYDIAFKYTHKVLVDKYEHISNYTFQTFRRSSFFSPYNQFTPVEQTETINSFVSVDTTTYINRVINVRCAVKSYLHLLQLF
jgi:hypothetical protein